MLQAVMRLSFLTICALGGFLPDRLAGASEITGLPSTKQECLIVHKARIVFPSAETSPGYGTRQIKISEANTGHQIADGTSTIFVFRRYEDAGKGPDSGTFTKLTLVLKSTEVRLSNGQAKPYDASSGFFVVGNDGYVDMGEYWRAANAVAQITMAMDSGKLTASLHKSFIAEDGASEKTKEIGLDFKCPVRMASVKELDSWEGKIGTDWESFAPAK